MGAVCALSFDDFVLFDGEEKKSPTHPPLRWRINYAVGLLYELTGKQASDDEKEMRRLSIDAAFRIALRFRMQLSLNAVDAAALQISELDFRKSLETSRKFNAIWSAIRPFLLREQIGSGKLAPAQVPPDERIESSSKV